MKDDVDRKVTGVSAAGISSAAESTPKHQKAAVLLRERRL
jgi:hypothetical protein